MSATEDLDILARTIFGESRGEIFQGQVAVAWVVMNRAARPGWWGGPSLESVCRRPQQFSCWNASDPNLPLMQAATVEDPHFMTALGIAALVMQRQLKDPTGAATNYHSTAIAPPEWTKAMVPLVTIGNHAFYREV